MIDRLMLSRAAYKVTLCHLLTDDVNTSRRSEHEGFGIHVRIALHVCETKGGAISKMIAQFHRNKIGLDVALEALKIYCKRRRPKFQKVLEFARACRVEKILRPYLEASI